VTGPSREVSQRDHIVCVAECAGEDEDNELEWAKRHMKEEEEDEEKTEETEEPAPRIVERKTELHYADPAPLQKRKGAVRHRTEQSTKIPDPEVLYRNLEAAVRELSGSLREWQEGMGGQVLSRLNKLEYRVDDIEYKRDHQSPAGKPVQQGEVTP
jgi:dihydrofolate reductase